MLGAPELSLATPDTADPLPRRLYVGGLGGYGSTTWQGLVPSKENINDAINMSTPIEVQEGGGVWGVIAGYELIPAFAIELSYMKYPDAMVTFDSASIFSFMNNDLTEFVSQTDTINVMGKVMFVIPHTNIRAYSSAGIASVHREDMLLDERRISPTFGVGLNYHLTENFMAELGGNYTAGFGESQLNPTNTYFPFLYSVSLRLAYFLV
jgi:hypothetical protein